LWERAARVLPADRAKTDQLLLAAADSHLLAGDFPEARRIYREVTSSSDDHAALRAAIGYENASWRPGLEGREALEMLTAALDTVDPDPTDPVYVRALASRGRAHAFCGEMREAGRVSSRALELARRLADDNLVAEALAASLLQAMTVHGSIALHHQRAVELRRIALETRDFDKLGPAGAYRALASYMGGELAGWYAGLEDMRLVVAKTGQPFWDWVVGCHEHCHQFMAGDFAQAEATAERLRQLGYTFGSDDTEGPYGIQMFMLRRETGRLEQVRPLITGDPAEDDAWLPGLLAMYTELGMDRSAHRVLWILLDSLDEAERATAVWPAVVTFLAQAAIRLADDDALDVVEPLVAEYDGFNLVVGQCVTVLGSAHLLLAQIHALRGDTGDGHPRPR
jgi:tetratricopeptide (TPR) repeat protein